ncbi:uncharacterized protein LOC128202671 isoform X2 [Mya arenaria]|uniref:uncharacterized protein LOC128202671 isoform X2 n=1 Tax=Mya arenaria TaxID=6604 RepID=UPI0022E6D4CF|nr:uncharacterized protein LOC128202671 isoform X2 [Mya arenaria]
MRRAPKAQGSQDESRNLLTPQSSEDLIEEAHVRQRRSPPRKHVVVTDNDAWKRRLLTPQSSEDTLDDRSERPVRTATLEPTANPLAPATGRDRPHFASNETDNKVENLAARPKEYVNIGYSSRRLRVSSTPSNTREDWSYSGDEASLKQKGNVKVNDKRLSDNSRFNQRSSCDEFKKAPPNIGQSRGDYQHGSLPISDNKHFVPRSSKYETDTSHNKENSNQRTHRQNDSQCMAINGRSSSLNTAKYPNSGTASFDFEINTGSRLKGIKSLGSVGQRSRLLQRQERVVEQDAKPLDGVQGEKANSSSKNTENPIKKPKTLPSLPTVIIEPAADSTDECDNAVPRLLNERQFIPRTQLVDPDGNVLIPGAQHLLPFPQATRVRYPGIIIEAKSPSGSVPVDTNQYYRYRSKALPYLAVRDFRYDPEDDQLIINEDRNSGVRKTKSEINSTIDKPFCEAFNKSSSLDNKTYVSNDPPCDANVIELKDLQSYFSGDKQKSKFNTSDRKLQDAKNKTDSKISPFPNSGQIPSESDRRKTVAFCVQSRNYDCNACLSPQGILMSGVSIKAGQLPQNETNLLSVEPRIVNLVTFDKQSRLHNQSSTETSGLGETITSGFSSQESVASYLDATNTRGHGNNADEDQGIDLSEESVNIQLDGNSTFGTQIIDSDNTINHTNKQKAHSSLPHIVLDGTNKDALVHTAVVENSNGVSSASSENYIFKKSHQSTAQMKEIPRIQIPTDTFKVGAYKPPIDYRSNEVKKPDTLKVYSANLGPDFDDLFKQSRSKTQQTNVGLQLEQINNEWNRSQRGNSIKSRSSLGSFRSRSGSTRRSNKLSRWMQWGADRRASYRRRQENLEKPPEVPRASTPVKKARQEGLVFIHPDLESKYISEDDINYIKRHQHERLKAYKLIEKAKSNKHQDVHDLNRVTAGDLMTLSGFWEHKVFIRSRYISIMLSLVTTLFHILSICSTEWVSYPSPEIPRHYVQEGLWFRCRPLITNNHIEETCGESATGRDWQKAVIGLMIFSAVFGFIAAMLAICGVCTSPLPKKIYYFHSAGEIFVVCAMSSTIALIVYAVAISTDETIQSHTYGSGYGLGWGGTAFFFAASFCMSLDELVRESAQNKCCRYIFWRSRNNDDDNSHPV